MSDGPSLFPEFPAERLTADGWVLEERSSETVFSLPGIRVEGHTLLYEQPSLRETIASVFETGNQPWRFFFATRITFRPPLGPGISPRSLLPVVRSEARRSFVTDLRKRGFESLERRRTRQLSVANGDGDRVRLTGYTTRFDTGELTADVEAWFGVRLLNGEFRVVGGAYPVAGFSSAGIDLEPDRYREELFGVIRGIR